MKFVPTDPPRTFGVGLKEDTRLTDCARIHLAPDEQVTFVTPAGSEYDVVRKSWGFYATPSLNGRLSSAGIRGVLVQNPSGRAYVLLVDDGRESEFNLYLEQERMRVLWWLDTDQAVAQLAARLSE